MFSCPRAALVAFSRPRYRYDGAQRAAFLRRSRADVCLYTRAWFTAIVPPHPLPARLPEPTKLSQLLKS